MRPNCRTSCYRYSGTPEDDGSFIGEYSDHFLYGSDQGATVKGQLVRKSYEAWDLLWKEIGPALTRQVARDNYIRVFNESRRNMRAREKVHPVE